MPRKGNERRIGHPVVNQKETLACAAMWKTTGDDQFTDFFKAGGTVVVDRLAALHTQCLTPSSLRETWKSANNLIHRSDFIDLETLQAGKLTVRFLCGIY